jgi:hypothetical protein
LSIGFADTKKGMQIRMFRELYNELTEACTALQKKMGIMERLEDPLGDEDAETSDDEEYPGHFEHLRKLRSKEGIIATRKCETAIEKESLRREYGLEAPQAKGSTIVQSGGHDNAKPGYPTPPTTKSTQEWYKAAADKCTCVKSKRIKRADKAERRTRTSGDG